MVDLAMLWLPILVSAVVVFFAASVMWMLMPHHRKDWGEMPGEEGVLEAMRKAGLGRGQYHFPACQPSEMKDPAVVEKLERGPVGLMVVMPSGVPNMNKSLVQYFVYCVVAAVFVAYVTGRCLGPGTEYLAVFRVAGTVAFLIFAGALPSAAIWFGRTWGTIAKEMFDGLVYALLTAGIFGWLWPS